MYCIYYIHICLMYTDIPPHNMNILSSLHSQSSMPPSLTSTFLPLLFHFSYSLSSTVPSHPSMYVQKLNRKPIHPIRLSLSCYCYTTTTHYLTFPSHCITHFLYSPSTTFTTMALLCHHSLIHTLMGARLTDSSDRALPVYLRVCTYRKCVVSVLISMCALCLVCRAWQIRCLDGRDGWMVAE